MILLRFSAATLMLFTSVALAHAGMGYNFGGEENSGVGRPFQFAVSSTSPGSMGMMTAEDFSGEDLGPGEEGRFGWYRRLEARYSPQSSFGSFNNSSPRFRGRGFRRGGGAGLGGGGGSSFGASGGGGGSARSLMVDEQTSGATPYNAGYCYCPGRPTVGGDGDDDDDTGSPTGGAGDDDDDDDGGPGGPGGGPGGPGPDPSVVPEPGSLTLWALAGALLIGVTRRKGLES